MIEYSSIKLILFYSAILKAKTGYTITVSTRLQQLLPQPSGWGYKRKDLFKLAGL
jgi:hypothetical protein